MSAATVKPLSIASSSISRVPAEGSNPKSRGQEDAHLPHSQQIHVNQQQAAQPLAEPPAPPLPERNIRVDLKHFIPVVAQNAANAVVHAHAPARDILSTGEISDVLNNIDERSGNDDTEKLRAYLHCLSQALSSRGPYRELCESTLKDRIYQLVIRNPQTHTAVEGGRYRESVQLAPVIEKINYLVKPKFFDIKSCKNLLIFNTRFSHHLSKRLGHLGLSQGSRAQVCFIAGATFAIAGGMSQLYSTGEITFDRKTAAGPAMALGFGMMLAPFLSAQQAATGDNP